MAKKAKILVSFDVKGRAAPGAGEGVINVFSLREFRDGKLHNEYLCKSPSAASLQMAKIIYAMTAPNVSRMFQLV